MSNIEKLFQSYTDNFFVKLTIAGNSVDMGMKNISFFEFDSNTSGEASICNIKWKSYCYDSDDNFELNDKFSSIKIGSPFEVVAGYQGSLYASASEKIFSGFVFSSSIEIKDGISHIGVSGMDAKIWLMSNKTTEFKGLEQKYSDIVKNILGKYSSQSSGTEVNISDEPNSIRPGLHQNNESDFNFLRRIADMTGCFFYVLDGKFMFESIGSNSKSNLEIHPIGIVSENEFIKNIKFSSNLVGIPKSVSVNFTNNEEYSKENQSTEVKSSTKIGSGKVADNFTSNITNSINVVNFNITSQEDAKFIANSIYRKKSLNFVTCEITFKFLPGAKVGSSANMSGFGAPLDNNYIITSVNHKYDGNSFETTLELSSDSMTQMQSYGNLSGFSSFF